MMKIERNHLPDTDRLSVLTATILLTYALLPFLNLPTRALDLQFLGISFGFSVNASIFLAIFNACLAAVGTDWLLQSHPGFQQKQALQHALVPALTALVIAVPLGTLTVSWQWWVILGFGGLLLVLVWVAEYIAVDLTDVRHTLAVVALTAVSFALLLMLLIALSASDARLYVLLPGVLVAVFFVSMRTLYLRMEGQWQVVFPLIIALITGQVAAALHYLPLTALQFGLILLAVAYTLTSIAGSLEEQRSWRTLWIEPALIVIVIMGITLTVKG